MILPKAEDAVHKAQLYRLLTEMLDDSYMALHSYFKGGTCAAMLGFLDRFSIDLDFDIKNHTDKKLIHKKLTIICRKLDLEIKQKSADSLFYILKYQAKIGQRNSIKLSLIDKAVAANTYKPFYLADIDRYCICQTKETMFANKLVAVVDRYKKYKTIAGRDIYDVHYFFLQGYGYNKKVIMERTGENVNKYLIELVGFIEKKINDRIITQDLNFLLPQKKFQLIRKVLKKETVMFLRDEIKRTGK